MKIPYRLILIPAVVLLLLTTGCSSVDPDDPTVVPDPQGVPMHFGSLTGAAQTLSRGDGDDLQDVYTRFGVWAWKTRNDAPENVMNHSDFTPYEVVWSDEDRWHYDITTTVDGNTYVQSMKYWDLSATQYDFMAFAPFRVPDTADGASTQGSVTFDPDTRVFTINSIQGNRALVGGGIPWLHAHTLRTIGATQAADYDMLESSTTPISPSGMAPTERVPLVFHHLTTTIEIRTYTLAEADIKATTFNFSLSDDEGNVRTISTKGSYVVNPGTVGTDVTLDTTPTAQESDIHRSTGDTNIKALTEEEIEERRTKSTLVTELCELPQDVSGLYANIEVITSDDTYNAIIPLKQPWLPGYTYIYYVILPEEEYDEEYIVMDVDVEVVQWQHGEDIVIEDPVTNW